MRDLHFSLETVLDDLPMAQGWALIAWASEHNPWCALDRAGPGYIAQEIAARRR